MKTKLIFSFCLVILTFCPYFISSQIHFGTKYIKFFYTDPMINTSNESQYLAFFFASKKGNGFITIFDPIQEQIIFQRLIDRSPNFLYFNDKEKLLCVGMQLKPYELLIFNFEKDTLIKSIKLDTNYLQSTNLKFSIADISPDCRYLIVQFGESNAKIFDIENDSLVFDFEPLISEMLFSVYSLKFSKDGKKIAILSPNKLVLFDLEERRIEQILPKANYYLDRVYFSDDDKYFIKYANSYKKIELYEISNGEIISEIQLKNPSKFYFIDSFLVVEDKSNFYIWNMYKGVVLDSLLDSPLHFCDLSGMLKINSKVYILFRNCFRIDSINFSEYDVKRYLFVDVESKELFKELKKIDFFNDLTTLAFMGSGEYFIGIDVKGKINVFETETGKLIHKSIYSGVSFIPQTTLFHFSRNDTIFIGSILNDSIVDYFPIELIKMPIEGFQFFGGLEYAFVSDTLQTLYLFDWNEKEILYAIDSNVYFYTRVFKYSNDRNYLAYLKKVNGNLGKLKLIHIPTNELIYETQELGRDFHLTFSQDSRYLFYCYWDSLYENRSPVYQIDLKLKEIVKIYDFIPPDAGIREMKTFPDRPWLALLWWEYDKPYFLKIYNYETGEFVAEIDNYPHFAFDVISISPNGKYLLGLDNKYLVMLKVPEYSPVEEKEHSEQLALVVYTTEAKQLKVSFKLDGLETINLIITDILGRPVYSHTEQYYFSGNYTEQIQLPFIARGVYILVVRVGEQLQSFKLNIFGE